MSAATKMRALVERVRNRAEKAVSSGPFGYGICPADAYVARGIAEIGDDGFEKAGFQKVNAEQAIKEAAQRLTYCNSAMVVDNGGTLRMEKTASPGRFRDFLPEGMQPPEHTLMLLKYTLTAPTKDRDGDILRTEGAVVDPRGPLLWQHMANALIGRHVLVTEHHKDALKEVSALLDLNEFTEDVAKMVEADALRFSHGFQALEWEEIKSGRGGVPTGFDVKKFEVLERSLVSCPSNVCAVMELFSRQKFHSEPIKRWAKSMHDSRAVQVKGFCLKHNVLPSVAARIPEQVIGALEDAAEQPPIRWAKSMPECFDRLPRMEGDKLFDPAGESLKPATLMHDWVSKYLDVPIKQICESHASVPSAKMGAWLTALETKLAGSQVDDVRNIGGDSERPPQYEAIQLTSTKSDTFLVDGTRFVRFPEMKCVLAVEPAYFGIHATLYTDLERRDANIAFFTGVHKLADEYKFLKGEAFSLSGDFLTRDGSTVWDDVFLTKKNETAVRHATAMLAEKGGDMPSRGVMMLGPPGSGKTMSGRAMMNECKGATFIWIAARDFYHCGSFGGFSYAFDMAKELAPCILFFEDVDNWMRDTAVDLLKTEMDGLTQNKGILTVLTTNHPEQLPKALIDRPGRFHDVLLFDNPTEAVREKMIGRWLPDADDKQRAAAVKRTEGWSGAHVYELCAYAKATAEQDKLDTGEALVKSLDKIAEQRQLIDEVQGRRTRYEPTVWERAVTDVWLKGVKAKAEGMDDMHMAEMKACMKACEACEDACETCAAENTAENCEACSKVCQTCAEACDKMEGMAEAKACAAMCRDCQGECDKGPSEACVKMCEECATVCRECADVCEKMMGSDESEEAEPEEDKSTPTAEKSIREVDGEFCVFSEAGKNMGCFPTKPEAEERLAQIERFGGKDGEPDGTKYSPDQPRAEDGTFGEGSGGASSGGKESYNDRIEGTQKEADREVKRASKKVDAVKAKISALENARDASLAEIDKKKNETIAAMEDQLKGVRERIDSHREGMARGAVRLKRIKEILKIRPSKWTDEQRAELAQMEAERKADQETFNRLEKKSASDDSSDIASAELDYMKALTASWKRLDADTDRLLKDADELIGNKAVSRLDGVKAEDDPPANKLVCEDCGYSMPMDEAEDGKMECPECGGKMNPAGEKATSVATLEPTLTCAVQVIQDLLKFGSHDGKCTNHDAFASMSPDELAEWKSKGPSCRLHINASVNRIAQAKAFIDVVTKAGRVLSQRNMDGLVEAAADLEEAMDVDKVPRKCAALVERAHKRLVTVIDSAQPAAVGDEARPDARPKEPTGKSAEKTLGQFLATAEANELSTIQEIIAARLDVIHRDARADALKSRGLI